MAVCAALAGGVGPVSYTHLDVYKRQGPEAKFFNGHTNITDSSFVTFGVKGVLQASRNLRDALLFNLSLIHIYALLGLGIMLAAGEVPRIAGQFGLDTSTRANLMSSVYAAQSAVNLTRTIVQAAAK